MLIDYSFGVPRNNTMLLVLAMIFACGLSFLGRYAQGRDLHLPGTAGWVTMDADSLYHMRRVDLCLANGGEVAGTDSFLNYPEGAAIPWPPYYTSIASKLVAPFVSVLPEERQASIEEGVGSLALVFGVLTTLVAVLAGAMLAGRVGAFAAGTYHALCHMSIAYSVLGNGDHHSFVSFISGALLLILSWFLAGERLRERRNAVISGVLAGVLLGILIGSWLGSMVLLVGIELVLACLIFRSARHESEGLAVFGLSFHLAALVTLWPAVAASPWTEIEPWMLVNLSYFHPAFLVIGALVFAPLLRLKAGSLGIKRYPWVVGAVLGVVGLVLMFTDLAVARALREGFDWASKTNRFMAGISESRSLFAAGASPSATYELGAGLWLLPLAMLFALHQVIRKGLLPVLPWLIAGMLAALQAAQQARFAESLALPLAVLLGWGLARACEWKSLPKAAVIPGAILLAALANGGSTLKSFERALGGKPSAQESELPATLAMFRASRWIAANTPASQDYSVMADWSAGHLIEWSAQRPSVATNFGSYVGEDSFRDPARFFMEEDPHAAEALLRKRGSRYVLLPSNLPDYLNSLVERSHPERRDRWIQSGTEGQVTKTWFNTMGARLMFDGMVFMNPEAPQLDFLRLVYVSPIVDPTRSLRDPQDKSPGAWVWEQVEGARVTREGKPGEELHVEVQLSFPRARRNITWSASALANNAGLATLRVPYATTTPNGEGQITGAWWSMGELRGQLKLSEIDVQAGRALSLNE